MPKNTIRDILPPEDRPRRRQSVERRPMSQRPMATMGEKEQAPPRQSVEIEREFHHDLPPKPDRLGKMKFVYIALGVILVLFFLLFVFSMFFGGATVTVHPKQETLTVNGTFEAVRENPGPTQLGYELMTLESMLSKVVPATGREEVEERASGNIRIFNNHDSNPQKLIRNTRFETPDGKIYRIDKSIVVPGQSDGEAGTIEVTVYADEPGESYNIGKTTFTIPGFKGAPQFETFSAESITDMTGGFAGERLVVEESVLEQERTQLHEALRTELMSQVENQKPEGFVGFPSGIFIDFVSLTPQEKGSELEIQEKAVLYYVLFAEEDLAQYLADNTLGSFNDEEVTFLATNNLSMAPREAAEDETIRPWSDPTFDFSMNGTAPIVWIFDEARLKEDLSGRNKEAIHTILSGYPSIDEAEVVIRPFWKGSFPASTEEIDIEIVLAEEE